MRFKNGPAMVLSGPARPPKMILAMDLLYMYKLFSLKIEMWLEFVTYIKETKRNPCSARLIKIGIRK